MNFVSGCYQVVCEYLADILKAFHKFNFLVSDMISSRTREFFITISDKQEKQLYW